MRLFHVPFFDAADAGAGGGTEKAAADAAAATEAKAASDKAAADAAAAAAIKPGSTTTTTTEQTPEQKAAAEAAATAARANAPDKYALTLPDGGLLSAKDLSVFEAQARKANLSNADAQLWIDEQYALLKEQVDALHAETIANADYGGEKLAESQRLANAVIERFRPAGHKMREDFLAFIRRAGSDRALPVVAFLADIGKAMGEDTVTQGKTGGSGARKSDAEVLALSKAD